MTFTFTLTTEFSMLTRWRHRCQIYGSDQLRLAAGRWRVLQEALRHCSSARISTEGSV